MLTPKPSSLILLILYLILFQFSDEIQTAYDRRDIVGKISKVVFAPALQKDQKPSSPISGKHLVELQRPKLRLRFLGSYSTMLYLGLLFIFVNLWLGIGPVQYILFLLVFTCLFGVLRALMISN